MLDLNSEAVRADPYPAYAQMRELGPVFHDETSGTWYVGRYEDVQQALKNSEVFSNRESGLEPSLLGADGDAHRAMRRLIQPAFAPQRIAGIEPAIVRLAQDVVQRMDSRASCEFMSEVASVVPASILAWMLGDNGLTADAVRTRTEGIMLGGDARLKLRRGGPGTGLPSGMASLATPEGLAESEVFLRQVLERAAREETGGWIADLLAAEYRAGRLSAEEFVDLGLLFIVGATETTTAVTGTAVLMLARDREVQQRLREEPSLIGPFVDEILRFDPPVQRRRRLTTVPTQIGGVSIPAGAVVVLLIGAANRDPDRFADPDTFDLDRADNRHLSFGSGSHACPGAQLGRMEIAAMLASLLARMPPFRLAEPSIPIEQPANLSIRGPRKLHLAFDTR